MLRRAEPGHRRPRRTNRNGPEGVGGVRPTDLRHHGLDIDRYEAGTRLGDVGPVVDGVIFAEHVPKRFHPVPQRRLSPKPVTECRFHEPPTRSPRFGQASQHAPVAEVVQHVLRLRPHAFVGVVKARQQPGYRVDRLEPHHRGHRRDPHVRTWMGQRGDCEIDVVVEAERESVDCVLHERIVRVSGDGHDHVGVTERWQDQAAKQRVACVPQFASFGVGQVLLAIEISCKTSSRISGARVASRSAARKRATSLGSST